MTTTIDITEKRMREINARYEELLESGMSEEDVKAQIYREIVEAHHKELN